jgi:hypothetical protein
VAALRESAEVLYAGEPEIRLGEGLLLATGLTLSVREFELLAAMARRMGAIVTRDELYGAARGCDLRTGRPFRRRLCEQAARASWNRRCPTGGSFIPHPGFGYRFQPQPAAGAVQSRRRRQMPAKRPLFHKMFTLRVRALSQLVPAAGPARAFASVPRCGWPPASPNALALFAQIQREETQ